MTTVFGTLGKGVGGAFGLAGRGVKGGFGLVGGQNGALDEGALCVEIGQAVAQHVGVFGFAVV